MTVQAFENDVKCGRKLVILDNLVLDVAHYLEWHPGGKFVLEHNVGRDISKFFYGGYTLEENLSGKSPQGHMHSSQANIIVNKLAIAQLEKPGVSQVCKIAERNPINSSTATILFRNENAPKVSSDTNSVFQKYYPGLESIGKHFLVSCKGDFKLYRHYTISNAMAPDVYSKYIRCLKENDGKIFPSNLLQSGPSNEISLTIKDYKRSKGLSAKIHAESSQEFEIMGPLGKGLQAKESGLHVAFAAGTGVLCFIDIVAHLILAHLGILSALPQKEGLNAKLDSFRFVFYVSFPSVKESVGLELLEAFHDYCQKHGLKTFELKKRISNEGKPPRWDEKFVSNELEKLAEGELERVWVCGPPVMNETFDRVLSSPQCSVPKDKFEIL